VSSILLSKKRFARNKLFLLFLSLVFTNTILYSQLNIRDSLLNEIKEYRTQNHFNEQDTLHINNLLELATELRYYNLDSLYVLTRNALDLSRKSGYIKGKTIAFSTLGLYYSDKGKHTLAIEKFQLAMQLAAKMEESKLLLEAKGDLAREYEYLGDYSKALQQYLETVELAQKADEKEILSVVNENIANLYISLKDYDQAMVFYKKVKAVNTEIGDPVFMAETMSNMASAFADMGELDHAMYNANSSIKTFEDKKIIDWLAYAYQIKGKVYLKREKYNWAMYWYNQSCQLYNGLNDKRSEITLLNGMAEASLGLKKDSLAEVYALKAYDYAIKIKDKLGIQESSKILHSSYKAKGDFETALVYHERYQEVTNELSKNENEKGLTMLKTKIQYDQQRKQLILENEKALAKQKVYIYIALFILLIFLGITMLIRKNAEIQKKLNVELISKTKDLEKKEEHLKDLNHTKDKLFSIIGHDLRGPIGAFQGLIKLFKEGEMSKEEFLSFVPKLKTDIDHISFTLNNLLSWGQTQMNGSITKPAITALETIVEDNIALLSEIAANKSIKLINRLEYNTLTWSDSDQMDIVIRNLISNALKFTSEKGMVTIGAIEKLNHWEIYVRDNGIGMDEETMGKIFSKNSSHTTYGTNDEKGTGLGLSLCKEMVEKNNGIIWVDSAPNKGSSFYFTTPKAKKKYKKTA
jgi:signal transduction histidine kinase